MGSPTIFSGRYTKLLTQKGLLQQGGAVNQYDGLRNYIKNSSFESNTDEGWNRVKTTITGNLPTGTPTIGKVIAVAPSISSFGPFSGSAPFDTYALRFGNIISTVVAGEGVISDAFTVDPGDRGKVLTFKLYYQSDAGASTDNWSGVLGSQTWAVYIYDQTAGAWLQPTGFLGMNQNSGVGVVSGTFQSSVVAGQQYRIAVIALRNTTATSALQIDDVYVGPQTAPIGPVVTDFQAYIPATTGFNAGTTPTIFVRWRRVGDSIHIIGNYVAGGAGIGASGDFEIFLPSGLSFDLTKVSGGGAIGAAEVHNAGSFRYSASTIVNTSTSIKMTVRSNAALGGNNVSNAQPDLSWWNAAGDQFSFEFMAPIQGWSSSVQMSNDTDTRVVAFRANNIGASTTSVPNGGVGTKINNLTMAIDTHGTWNNSTQAWTVPVSGIYDITASVYTASFTGSVGLGLIVDGTFFEIAGYSQSAASPTTYVANRSYQFNAGTTISLGSYQNSGATQTYGAFNPTSLKIQRLSGPSVIAASETVAAKYYLAGAVSTSPTQPINFATKSYDTHNAVTIGASWRFNTPVSGLYRISNVFVNGSLSAFDVALYLNGSIAEIMTSGDNSRYWNGTTSLRLNAGDYIDLRCTAPTTTASVTAQRIVIERIGN